MNMQERIKQRLAPLKRYDTAQEALRAAIVQTKRDDGIYSVGKEPESKGGKYVVVGHKDKEIAFARAGYEEVYGYLEVYNRGKSMDAIEEK